MATGIDPTTPVGNWHAELMRRFADSLDAYNRHGILADRLKEMVQPPDRKTLRADKMPKRPGIVHSLCGKGKTSWEPPDYTMYLIRIYPSRAFEQHARVQRTRSLSESAARNKLEQGQHRIKRDRIPSIHNLLVLNVRNVNTVCFRRTHTMLLRNVMVFPFGKQE
ncbi:hypothetical protein BWQ96_10235 [Gracilariopsis chorda]|uniref:Uncharacterized protein n=1 Tax=Gracilariopsis chorda TaxID=448386 RepID=A0A2V3ID89_9FLOR|nr:hypothetical protein BWQ96_10235 [Gracilariopsis chorda]|eukprot:PXF40055.1 hypothetical protein BWQ96_10235 [Gracilariopsis chorda]